MEAGLGTQRELGRPQVSRVYSVLSVPQGCAGSAGFLSGVEICSCLRDGSKRLEETLEKHETGLMDDAVQLSAGRKNYTHPNCFISCHPAPFCQPPGPRVSQRPADGYQQAINKTAGATGVNILALFGSSCLPLK